MLQDRLRSSVLQRSAPGTLSPPIRLRALVPVLASFLAVAPAAIGGPFDDPGLDPSMMLAWATSVEDFTPGFQDIADPMLGLVSFGLPEDALGPVSSENAEVVSLGDAGSIVLHFDAGIGDGPGDDFAVFENGFFTSLFGGGLFAELAFVEVSSDGVSFARLPPTSLNTLSVDSFDPIDPSDYDNLAGDQPIGLGTGFDLRDVASDPLVLSGVLDLTDVQYVRLVDVIGDGSTIDDVGAPIYDPYPTPFVTGGFDLEAVGVIHDAPEPGLGVGLATGVLALVMRRTGRRGCDVDG